MATTARLKSRYLEEIRPALVSRFGYTSVMQAPKIEKITLNTGVGDARNDSSAVGAASNQLAAIAGQRPNMRRARKSIAAFKLREGMPVGVSVTLRGERGYEFLDRLTSIAIPRIRDFRGLNPRSFDGRGNYSMGVKEQTIFPEIDYGSSGQVRGMDITITTTAKTDVEAFALLQALGMPFARQGRPKDFFELSGESEPEEHVAEVAEPEVEEPEAVAEPQADEPQEAGEPEPGEPEAAAETETKPEAESAAEPEAAAEPEELVEAEEALAEEAVAEAEIVGEAKAAAQVEDEAAAESTDGLQEDAPGDGDAENTEKESTD